MNDYEWYYLLSLRHADQLTLRGHSAQVVAVAWHPDARRLASAGEDGTIKVWDTIAHEEILSLQGAEPRADGLAWSHDGRQLAAAIENNVEIWDARIGYRMAKEGR